MTDQDSSLRLRMTVWWYSFAVSNHMNTIEKIKERTKEGFPKEYVCHILFVYDIAMDLYKKKVETKKL